MSQFFVNAIWRYFRTHDGSPVTFVDCTDADPRFFVDTRDVLSEPAVEDLLPSGLALWPRGAAWGTPDNVAPSTDTVLAKLTRALLAPFADLYARAWMLTTESRAGTVDWSLEEWERDYDLPGPCVEGLQSVETRKRHLRTRVSDDGAISPEDFVRLAARIGYVVAIEEPDPFRAGVSRCGSADQVASIPLAQHWIVHLLDVPVTHFHAGVGQAGVTRLTDFDISDIECLFRRVKPAWTYVTFNAAGWPTDFFLGTEDGDIFATEDSDLLVAPVIV